MLRRAYRSFVAQAQKAGNIEEYSKALELISTRKFNEAVQELEKCLGILEERDLYGQPDYNFVLQRLALAHRLNSDYPACEDALEKVVQNYLVIGDDYPQLRSKAYANLALQYLQSNVKKAIQLCNWLQRPDEWKTLDRDMQKDVHFFIGTGYLLYGNYRKEAIHHFETCLRMNPEARACFVLHNLACAQWWQYKNYEYNPDTSNDYKSAAMEFVECIPNFQTSIQILEGLSEPFKPNDPVLKVKASGLSLTNIAEVLLETGNETEGSLWLRAALKHYETLDKPNIGRAYTLTALYLEAQGQAAEAKEMLEVAVKVTAGRNDFNEIFALESLAKVDSSRTDCLESAKLLRQKMFPWAERAAYLHVPTWSI
mmetsp:Transcript_25896/g.45764  ORF Transcript_25896/g.45764 Transcript_25896/m.45764 type:complete len:370 (+) Transcript_25896:6269-7378(+)